jgi:phosphoglycerate dehydrogenase-like enzyme/predicted dehydrogenase
MSPPRVARKKASLSNHRMTLGTSLSPLRVLVIGAGPAAFSMHLPAMARLRDKGMITLAMVCDIAGERAALARRKFGFLEQSGDATASLMASDIDAVYLFAGAALHYEYGLAALRAGKHLFVEKPIAPSFVQAREMADVAHARGLVAVGGHNRRFFPALLAAKARAGKAGWRGAEATFHKSEFGKPPPFGARSWLSANGIHALDALIFMMGGLPQTIAAQAAGAHVFSALMHWQDGRSAVFLCNNAAGARREDYIFHSSGESCCVEETRLIVEKGGVASVTAFHTDHDGLTAEHEAFLHAVRGGGEPVHSLAALAPSLFLAERIEEGFSGHLQIPQPRIVLKAASMPGKTILLVEGDELLGSLARHAGEFSLVSPADIRRAPTPRGDITAALLGRRAGALPADILDRLPNLNRVGFAGLSLAHLASETLLARGISLMHASEAYADSVAEFALGLAILGRRRAFPSHEILRAGGWGSDPGMQGLTGALRHGARKVRPSLKAIGLETLALGAWRKSKPLLAGASGGAARDLKGATAGLIGWGANARAFALRLADAGVRVLAWSEHGEIGKEASRVSLGEALAADIVSLHRGLTPATRHFLGAAELARLRQGAVLINVARGALIEPRALIDRLSRGDIFACLDTFEDEPLPSGHPLRRLPNVFLTAHIAGGAPEMHAAAAAEIVGKLAAHLRGEDAQIITAARLATMT